MDEKLKVHVVKELARIAGRVKREGGQEAGGSSNVTLACRIKKKYKSL